jgi:hypothetical protein
VGARSAVSSRPAPRPHVAVRLSRSDERPARRRANRAAVIAWSSVLLVALSGCSVAGPGPAPSAGRTPLSAASLTAVPAASPATSTSGTSTAALSYLAAVDAANPAWQALSAKMTAEQPNICNCDLLAQVQADAPFLTALRAITFPPEAAQAGSDLIAAIQAYDDFLMTGHANFSYYRSHFGESGRLQDVRAESSSRLRDALGLPQATASLVRP